MFCFEAKFYVECPVSAVKNNFFFEFGMTDSFLFCLMWKRQTTILLLARQPSFNPGTVLKIPEGAHARFPGNSTVLDSKAFLT